jgi:membrane-associated phospholipid phosphatase
MQVAQYQSFESYRKMDMMELMASESNDDVNSTSRNNGGNNNINNKISPINDTNYYNAPTISTMMEYGCNIHFMAELIFCTLVAALGHFAPKIIFQVSLYERDVPYQTTEEGDVILDMYINRVFINEETIPDWLVVVLCMIIPFVCVIVYSLVFGYKHDVHSSACFSMFAFGCTLFITNFVKSYCGYYRPNFYGYCGFNQESLSCEGNGDGNHSDDESRKSFPSGHASISFCGMTCLSLFFLGKIGLYSSCCNGNGFVENGEGACMTIQTSTSFLFKKRISSIVASLPMLLAVFIAASRVHDDFHHPADVVGGSIIGMLCAFFSYGLW